MFEMLRQVVVKFKKMGVTDLEPQEQKENIKALVEAKKQK